MRLVLYYLSAAALLIMAATTPVRGQSYNVSSIPDSLIKQAKAVVREEVEILEIKSPAKATVKRSQVITVLNERGEGLGGIVCSYDKFKSINSVSGTLSTMLRVRNKGI